MKLFFFSILFLYLSPSSLSCYILTQAFNSVSNFHDTYTNISCNEIQELNLSYKYLSGTVSWMLLKNISSLRSVDLSHNLLEGSVPGKFFSSSPLIRLNLANNHLGGSLNFKPNSIMYLNVSKNRFTNAFNISGLSKLQFLDMSHNNLTFIPTGLEKLQELNYLDFSYNSMHGVFPNDFSPSIIKSLHFLNLSYNNFSGTVNSSTVKKFGASAFTKAGTSLPQTHKQKKPKSSAKKKHKEVIIVVTVAVFAGLAVLLLLGYVLIILKRKRKINKGWKEEEKGVRIAKEVSSWVAEAKWAAQVVMFEKPLMELSFSDVAAATSGFSKEWQLGENISESGALYRAVLPGEMNVVVRVVEAEVVEGVTEIAKLRHLNLLPLLGYCDAGKGKLLIYEYMEKGDLHQWLHELPANHPYPEDHIHDSYDLNQTAAQQTTITITKRTRDDWPTRHNIALGIARGLAFLHQGWAGSNRPIVHPHLAPCNVLLDENLEPRLSDFATGGGEETMEGNVYGYGVLVMELVTGRDKWGSEEVERVRRSVRDGKGLREVDPTMRGSGVNDDKWEKEMVDCLRVSYLCTAQSPEKRPKMQQVVGLIKDVRSTSIDNIASSSSLCV